MVEKQSMNVIYGKGHFKPGFFNYWAIRDFNWFNRD